MPTNDRQPKRQRERMTQEERKHNPGGTMRDAANRSSSGSLTDLVNSLGWKGTGILILVLIAVTVIISVW
ncbi:DUF6366 family protein [Salisediminibacterium selenitireducens]|uniref:Phage capsid protein n=1 Tax=Bacillus selenitireducens (strain ATCC 700615 / DSM 15326 / MLS10) TaxID=439292 RepID=D6XYD5_BACIE|nr:DUF6366 family protein [Salisediminibacterium selenitireducens]ADI00204.1 hypothetical protein Bsel_2706 [[Bacillus] selenitireducens MLS10]